MTPSTPSIEALPWPQGELAIYRWPDTQPRQPRGVVLLVHGLGEHMGRYGHTADVLQQEHWICIGYDHLGHGRSQGDRGKLPYSGALVDGLVHVAQHVIAELPSKIARDLPLILLGHSLGGLVVAQAICTASDRMPDIRATVLSAPALGIHVSGFRAALLSTLSLIAPNLCLDHGLDPRSVCRDPMVVQAYVNDPLVHRNISIRLAAWMLKTSRQLPNCAGRWSVPLLMLLAAEDRLVDNRAAEHFMSKLAGHSGSIHREAEMFHEMLNDPEKERVLHKIADWLDLAIHKPPEDFFKTLN